MKFSIITAVYNNETSIKEAMLSVQNQSYANIEHIIIDGASTDGSLDIIKNLQNNNTILISEPDSGIYDALNKGIKKATGDIIGFLHSDDVLANTNSIKHIYETFKATQAHGVYGDLQYVQKTDTSKVVRNWKSKTFKKSNLYFGWMPAHPTLFLKKEVYTKHGSFNTTFRIAADYDFMLRILKDPTLTFEYLPQLTTKMRTGGQSNKALNIIQKSKEDLRAMKNNGMYGLFTLFCKNTRKIGQFLS